MIIKLPHTREHDFQDCKGTKNQPKRCQVSLGMRPEALQCRPHGAKWRPSGARLRLECSLKRSSVSRTSQVAPQSAQVEHKRHPRGSKLSLRGAQVGPKSFQEGLKSCQIAVQEHVNCKRARTSNFHHPAPLVEGLERSGRAAGGQVRGDFAAWRAKLRSNRRQVALGRRLEPPS